MQEFAQVGRAEQFRRLGALGREALRHYRRGPTQLVALRYGENATYRVTPAPALLRVHAPKRTAAALRVELDWLARLAAAGLPVPRPLATSSGARVVRVAVPGVPEPRCCTLLAWQPGRRVGRRPSPALLARIGAAVARLHAHALPFRRRCARPCWTAHALRHDPALRPGWRRLTPARAALWRRVSRQLAAAEPALGHGRHAFGLIHGDLTFDNFLVHRGQVRVIDFDDCAFGYFLFDLATLLDRMEWRANYPQLRAAFLAGYRCHRPLSRADESLLDTFLLARWAFLGLAFLAAPPGSPGRAYAPRFLRIVIPKIRRYLVLAPVP